MTVRCDRRDRPDRSGACQISQSVEFNALSKPPNALSRQGSVSRIAFERWAMAVRLMSAGLATLTVLVVLVVLTALAGLISAAFGFALARVVAVAALSGLASCR